MVTLISSSRRLFLLIRRFNTTPVVLMIVATRKDLWTSTPQQGILTEKCFLKLADAMEKKQESNQNCMQEIAAIISEEEHSEGDVQMFMGGEKSNGMSPLRNLMK